MRKWKYQWYLTSLFAGLSDVLKILERIDCTSWNIFYYEETPLN